MIKVSLQYEWQPAPGDGQPVEAALFRVLLAIAETGSLAEAARRLGVSYRHAWGLMGKWEKVFGKPLADLRQGQGTQLTGFGQKLLGAEQLVQARLTHELEGVRREIERALASGAEDSRLAMCASHDLALAALRDRLAQRAGLKLDLHFKGSLASLRALAKNRCSLAGFHIAEGMERAAVAAFGRLLERGKHALIGVATRTQGLMLARGNPKAIHSLADLTREDVRIVNRQRGSGSRIEFDQLLAGAGIDRCAIDGYRDEEFTHVAVAATVAAGNTDAGYGIRAAAAQYDLDYIPLLSERYYLACRSEDLNAPAIGELIELLRGDEFRAILAALPGYGTAITGTIYEAGEALGAGGYCISKAVRSSSKKAAAKRASAR